MKTYEVHTNSGGLQYVKGDAFTIEPNGVAIWREDDEPIAYFTGTGFISIQVVKKKKEKD